MVYLKIIMIDHGVNLFRLCIGLSRLRIIDRGWFLGTATAGSQQAETSGRRGHSQPGERYDR